MKKIALFLLLSCSSIYSFGQGTFSGDLMMNLNYFDRDASIKASGNPLYNNYLSGSEGWMDLRYNIKGFTFFVRADAFNNSNLKNPTSANTAFGVGAWSVSKELKDLTITAGYIYDQIGSGVMFRAYEDRGLLIDNALVGISLKYKLTNNIIVKGFTGQQKDNDLSALNNPTTISQKYAPVIRALDVEGDFNVGKVHLVPGVGMLNRTLDAASYATTAKAVPTDTAGNPLFTPKYNMYAYTAYNTLTIGNFSWYAEASYKSKDAIATPLGAMVNRDGNVEYTTIGFAKKGVAVNLTGKRTDGYVMRTSYNETLLNGLLNWQPIVARLRTQRLISRYSPASQDYSEQGATADVLLSPSDYTNYTLTYTNIKTLDNTQLYQEGYAQVDYLKMDKWRLMAGAQYLNFNIAVYDTRANAPMLKAITGFGEATYKITNKKSLRFEFEYMNTQQDYGSWVFALLEYNVAPKWSISASDMYNIVPNKSSDNPNYDVATHSVPNPSHYYNIYTAYTKDANRFSIAYVKQVDGINCSGGVCRYEPAFSGVKATLTSSF